MEASKQLWRKPRDERPVFIRLCENKTIYFQSKESLKSNSNQGGEWGRSKIRCDRYVIFRLLQIGKLILAESAVILHNWNSMSVRFICRKESSFQFAKSQWVKIYMSSSPSDDPLNYLRRRQRIYVTFTRRMLCFPKPRMQCKVMSLPHHPRIGRLEREIL